MVKKTTERITFIAQWIEAINKGIETEKNEMRKFQLKNDIFQLEAELQSRVNFVEAYNRDMALKEMNSKLPELIDLMDVSKLNKKERAEFNNISKRFDKSSYFNAEHKANDYTILKKLHEKIQSKNK